MKKAIISANGREIKITAPDDKEMVYDPAMLQHGILSLGEYGPSGTKICAIKDWDAAFFLDNGDEGYSFTDIEPF